MTETTNGKRFIERHQISKILAASGIIMVLSFSTCMSKKRMLSDFPTYVDPRTEGITFIESLRATSVDTIIGYFNGCVDCMPYRNVPYYVFWKSDNTWFTTKFDREKRYKNQIGYSPPMPFIERSLDSLQNESLVLPNFTRSAYGYDEVFIQVKELTFDYKLKHYLRPYNSQSHKVLVADSIKKSLLSIPSEDWEAIEN